MKVNRYFSLIYQPRDDETVCDMIWFDGMTRKVVLRYDLADPANRDPNYGATPDEYVLKEKGIDVGEKIEEEYRIWSPDDARNAYR